MLDPWLPGVGTNRYGYSFNDPINLSDPNGHQAGDNSNDNDGGGRGTAGGGGGGGETAGGSGGMGGEFGGLDSLSSDYSSGKKSTVGISPGALEPSDGPLGASGARKGRATEESIRAEIERDQRAFREDAVSAIIGGLAGFKGAPAQSGSSRGLFGPGRDFSQSVKDAAKTQDNMTCVDCGAPVVDAPKPQPDRANIDHGTSKFNGGWNTLENARTTCQSCNLEKRPSKCR